MRRDVSFSTTCWSATAKSSRCRCWSNAIEARRPKVVPARPRKRPAAREALSGIAPINRAAPAVIPLIVSTQAAHLVASERPSHGSVPLSINAPARHKYPRLGR